MLDNFITPEQARDTFINFRGSPFRPFQREAICFNSRPTAAEVVYNDAPTGSGKSLIGMVCARMAGSAIYLCSSKQLQNQLESEFPGVKLLKGRANYQCDDCKGTDCGHGRKVKCGYKGCPYKLAKQEALDAPIAVLNHAYFLTEANWVGKFSNRNLIVIDEADVLENMIVEFCSPEVPYWAIRELDLQPPGRKTATAIGAIDIWKQWGVKIGAKVWAAKKAYEYDAKHTTSAREVIDLTRKVDALSSLAARLKMFVANVDETWLFEEKKHWRGSGFTWSFKPLWITPQMANNVLWRHGARFILMSATMPPANLISTLYGLEHGDYEAYPVPSTFDPERRKVYCNPVVKLSSDNLSEKPPWKDRKPVRTQSQQTELRRVTIDKLTAEISAILYHNSLDKGVIHGVSYKLCQSIRAGLSKDSEIAKRLVWHESGGDEKDEMLERFIGSDRPLVLLSPSCERGVSLPYDLCRFIVFAKAPYLNLGDKITAARTYSGWVGSYWYASDMIRSVVQGAGRGMRSEDDFCRTYLLDEKITDAITSGKNRGIAPQWFMDALWWGNWRYDKRVDDNGRD